MKKQLLLLIILILCVNISVFAQIDSVKLKEIEAREDDPPTQPAGGVIEVTMYPFHCHRHFNQPILTTLAGALIDDSADFVCGINNHFLEFTQNPRTLGDCFVSPDDRSLTHFMHGPGHFIWCRHGYFAKFCTCTGIDKGDCFHSVLLYKKGTHRNCGNLAVSSQRSYAFFCHNFIATIATGMAAAAITANATGTLTFLGWLWPLL